MAMLKASGCRPTESGAGCCGMAGSFGYETEHYDISRKIGEERLFPALRDTPTTVTVAVTGVSCHQQIEHFAERTTQNIVEVLAERVDPKRAWIPKASEPSVVDTAVDQRLTDPALATKEPTPEETAHAKQQFDGPA
jgi:hypothetical protein